MVVLRKWTLRHAREQVKLMINDRHSSRQIQRYLSQWAHWWVCTVTSWRYEGLLEQFRDQCFDSGLKAFAQAMIENYLKKTPDALQEHSLGLA